MRKTYLSVLREFDLPLDVVLLLVLSALVPPPPPSSPAVPPGGALGAQPQEPEGLAARSVDSIRVSSEKWRRESIVQ